MDSNFSNQADYKKNTNCKKYEGKGKIGADSNFKLKNGRE